MLLTHIVVERAARRSKPYELRDGKGLFLRVTPSGTKGWRYRYEWKGKEQSLVLGHYPAMTIAKAREARTEARMQLQSGVNPSEVKRREAESKAYQQASTFEAVAREWHGLQKRRWSEVHADDVIGSLERLIFPKFGQLAVNEVTPIMVLTALRDIQNAGAVEVAHRVRQRVSAAFVYAVATSRASSDPAALLSKALMPIVKGRMPAVRTLEDGRDILRSVLATPAHPVTKLALVFLALTAVRPGSLRTTPWRELRGLDVNNPVWTVPPERLKLVRHYKLDPSREHEVPLVPQAIEILRLVEEYSGHCPYVFPNTRSDHRPMCENALGYLLNRAGYHGRHVPHGWRATFSTVMNGLYPQYSRVIDQMLAHTPQNDVEAAYNRQQHMALRRKLAEEWANMLLDGFSLQAFCEGASTS